MRSRKKRKKAVLGGVLLCLTGMLWTGRVRPYDVWAASIAAVKQEEKVTVNYLTGETLTFRDGEWYLEKRNGHPVTGLQHLNVAFGEQEAGFYYFLEDGRLETGPAVRHFQETEVYGVSFDGYYYHGANGRFYAKAQGLVCLSGLTCREKDYDGIYYVGAYGKLAARERPRLLEEQKVEGQVYPAGWYYFEKGGRLCERQDFHEIHGTFDGTNFDGQYLFGEPGGSMRALTEEEAAAGKELPVYAQVPSMAEIEKKLKIYLADCDGQWQIYLKNLNTEESCTIGSGSMYSASTIKVYVMAAVYESLEMGRLEKDQKLQDLLYNMIVYSDNESYNELVRRLGEGDFAKGAKWVNAWLTLHGYEETECHHTLQPAPSASASDASGKRNLTSAEECGRLLESIYQENCVSAEASREMLDLLLAQDNRIKIPAGLPEGTKVANKTGETDTQCHDMAIVWGESCTYILCVMSTDFADEGTAIGQVQEMSKMIYEMLNP